ncbi:hypothetical protein PW52_05250 [Tamlana sedimentorum]|uniref:Uncharacterized protein n=1 Tax=Neotamlana sedimentorum TaxID=1435349 RepID=A0A0D7WA50_9FLAO|nr:hypothetical protein [Tamlana sedimentorum]KJD36025.1 hypothetical protein PW52_05250 [Tamlana sedimentorum]
MKKHLLLLLAFTLLFFNCETDSDTPSGDYVTCKINGDSFTSTYTAGYYSFDILSITGIELSSEKFVNITILNPIEGATYNLGAISDETDVSSITAGLSEYENYTAGFDYGSGTITLTHFDDNSAAGTFSVIAEFEEDEGGSIEITSGKFSVTSFL